MRFVGAENFGFAAVLAMHNSLTNYMPDEDGESFEIEEIHGFWLRNGVSYPYTAMWCLSYLTSKAERIEWKIIFVVDEVTSPCGRKPRAGSRNLLHYQNSNVFFHHALSLIHI